MIRLTIPEIGEEEIQAVARVLRSGNLVQGENVQEFERLVAEYTGIKHAVAVSSGTAALHLALLSLDIGPGDEVILPDFTFPSTANVVELAGAKPVLVDIDLSTFNINTDLIEPAITGRTRAIMPVHLFGLPAEMDPVMALARKYNLKVIEDAACALGAEYRDSKCGTIGDTGCFSFHPRKNITTGEGGMLITDDDTVAGLARQLRNHGMEKINNRVQFKRAGFNYRMTDFQGVLGVVQMGKLEKIIRKKQELARIYNREFADMDLVTCPVNQEDGREIWQSYVILLNEGIDRDMISERLKQQGVETTIGTYAVSSQPHYAKAAGRLPNSDRAFKQSLCLPFYPKMSLSDIEGVVRCLKKAIR
jgi:dTDP-4-amino-4,6-dideoxygalactose transaminase